MNAQPIERSTGMVATPEVMMTPQPDGRVYLEVAGQLADDIHSVGRKRCVPAAVVLREAIAERGEKRVEMLKKLRNLALLRGI